jgi:molecular chaperone GrpE
MTDNEGKVKAATQDGTSERSAQRGAPGAHTSGQSSKDAIRSAMEAARKEPKSETTSQDAATQDNKRPDVKIPKDTVQKQIADLTDTLKRVQADFENHIKQSEKRSAQQCEQASARVLMKILSIVDDFERSLKTLEEAKIDNALLEGMRMVNKNIHGVLEAEGVRPIDCVGKKLDPFRHEVLRRVKKDGVDEDVVLEEHVKGYMLKDKVLRHSKVTVAQGKKE